MTIAASIRWSISRPNVVHETIDGEVVTINLDTGSYYSLDRAGADVWALIERGATTDEIVQSIGQRYDGDPTGVRRAIVGLLEELRREGLIVADGTVERIPPPEHDDAGPVRPGFEAPVLRKYTDMQELIMLDPVHEVDETGWPNRKPEPTGAD